MSRFLALCMILLLLAGCAAGPGDECPPPVESPVESSLAEPSQEPELPEPEFSQEPEPESQAPPQPSRPAEEVSPPSPEERELLQSRERTPSGDFKQPGRDRDTPEMALEDSGIDPEDNELTVSLEMAYEIISANLLLLDYVPDRYELDCSGVYLIGEVNYYFISIYNRDTRAESLGDYCIDAETARLYRFETDQGQIFLVPLTD